MLQSDLIEQMGGSVTAQNALLNALDASKVFMYTRNVYD